MATKFLEPGGDATFNVATTTAGGFWDGTLSAPTGIISSDFVNSPHLRSIKIAPGGGGANVINTASGVLSDSGGRFSEYIYFVARPTTFRSFTRVITTAGSSIFRLYTTATGVLQLWNAGTAQIGTDGPTLNLNQWYRISLAYTITSTTVNRFEVFVDGISAISVTNATLNITGTSIFSVANNLGDTALDFRVSDIYVDDSSSLTDMGDVKVIAKRPNSNGTANNFTTQIGTGDSGAGTGHAPQVNERPLSNINGWSVVAVGATTEEYNIEPANGLNDLMKEDGSFLLQESSSFIILDDTSNVDITTKTIVDYMGWVDYKTVLSETASIVVNGVITPFTSTVNAETMFTTFAGSNTYPSGTGTDIGMVSDATATTVSLYECGVIFAYTPVTINAIASPIQEFMLLGVGI